MRKRVVILLLTFACFLSVQSQTVTNVQPKQVEKTIEVTYQLSEEADVALWVSFEGGQYVLLKKVSGDVGMNISKGRKKIVWNVLEEFSSFSYDDVRFKVVTTQSFNNYLKEKEKKEKEEARAKKKEYVTPLFGFDFHGGAAGIGASGYWGYGYWGKRWGNYVSYTFGFKDLFDSNVSYFHKVHLGVTCAVSDKFYIFAAPGLHISARDWNSDIVDYNFRYSFAVEGGFGVRFEILTLNLRASYPFYVGAGIGVNF